MLGDALLPFFTHISRREAEHSRMSSRAIVEGREADPAIGTDSVREPAPMEVQRVLEHPSFSRDDGVPLPKPNARV